MIDNRVMFKDMQSAVWWAWYGSADAANTVKGPAWAAFQADDERDRDADAAPPQSHNPDVGGVPRGLLAAGQAGAIKRHVMAMAGAEGAHIMVKFLKGRERHEARRILRRLVADYIDVHGKDRRAAGLLLSLFYRRHTTITPTTIAEKLGLDRRRVMKTQNRVRITLDALSLRAENHLYNELRNRGVIR